MSAAPGAAFAELAAELDHAFAEPAWLEQALTHPSWAAEHPGAPSNQRLEFLGDAVLDLVIGQQLFERHPDWGEGELTRARAALVNTRALAARAEVLGLGATARLGRTEQREGGTRKPRILANLFEAVVGALYLDGGLEPVVALVRERFATELACEETAFSRDPKTRFQEWTHARFRHTPRYRTIADSGIENAEDRFAVEVELEGERWGRGSGRTKRAAERAAARAALELASERDGERDD